MSELERAEACRPRESDSESVAFAKLHARLDAQDKVLGRLERAVLGDETGDRPGLLTRADRLETIVAEWKRNLAAVVKAVIGVVVTAGGAGALWLAQHAK